MLAYTFATMLAERTRLFVNCADPRCGHSAGGKRAGAGDKFGADHGVMHDDLVDCSFVGAATRPVGTRRSPAKELLLYPTLSVSPEVTSDAARVEVNERGYLPTQRRSGIFR